MVVRERTFNPQAVTWTYPWLRLRGAIAGIAATIALYSAGSTRLEPGRDHTQRLHRLTLRSGTSMLQ
jgi:hypothetical protein